MGLLTQAPYYTTAAITAAGVIGGAYYAYNAYQDSQKRLPEEWREVGVLKSMSIFPVKSCGPIDVDQAECTYLGLKDGWLRDRILMIVDCNNNFQTARHHSKLLTVKTSVVKSILTLKHVEMEPIDINLEEVAATKKPQTAMVWSVPVPVYDCGPEASEWFCKLLDKSPGEMRLVYYASHKCRDLHGAAHKFYRFTKNDTAALGDEASFHLVNEASIDDLNSRLKKCQISARSYRPNFLVSGPKAFDEDNWKYMKIGENIFQVMKPCTRCLLSAIDPGTGTRNANLEALEMLKEYRQVTDPEERKIDGPAPRFGVQLALRSGPGGVVKINDIVCVA